MDKRVNALIASLALVGIGSLVLIVLPNMISSTTLAVGLTATIIVGVVALMAVLVLASFILDSIGLSSKYEALGLPIGSVRAIIALSLILIFAIMAVFMFDYLNSPQTTSTIIVNSNFTIGNTTFTNSTSTSTGTSTAVVDFAKQTLTTVSTLVVAIAAFYFGTKSVMAAKGKGGEEEEEEAKIVINPSEKYTWYIGQKPIDITANATPETALVLPKIKGDKPERILTIKENELYRYSPSLTETKEVTLTFCIPEYSEAESKQLKITVAKPEFSIDPTKLPRIKKGQAVVIRVKETKPEDAKIEYIADKQDPNAVTVKVPNKEFKYTPTIEEGEVTITFKMSEFSDVTQEVKVTIVKPDFKVEATPTEIKKGQAVVIRVKETKPEDAKIEYIADKQDPNAVTVKVPNKEFKYTPTIEEGEVTITFKMSEFSDVTQEVKIKVTK